MKRILEISIFLLSFTCNAQDVTIRGFYTSYQSDDSVAHFYLPHSKTIYNSNSEKMYEEYFVELGDSTSDLFFEDYRKKPELTIKGWIKDGDTSKYLYSENCETGEKLLIEGQDTSYHYTIYCVDNEVIKIVYNDSYLSTDTLTKFKKGEYWKTTLSDGTTEYTVRKFDSQGRVIVYRDGLQKLRTTKGNYLKIKYDDKNYIEKHTSFSRGTLRENATIIITYCDENWIPKIQLVTEIINGEKTKRRFEFFRVE